MDDTINISRIQTITNYEFKQIYNEAKHYEDETCNDSHYLLSTHDCKYFTSVELSKAVKPGNISLSMFCINSHSLEAHWDSLQELLF